MVLTLILSTLLSLLTVTQSAAATEESNSSNLLSLDTEKNTEKSKENLTVNITRVTLLSRPFTAAIIKNNAVITLNYNDRGIRVDYVTTSRTNDQDIRYKYQLTGQSNIDYPESKATDISFLSLSSGQHTLTIRAKSVKTGQYSLPVTITFNVQVAPWRSSLAWMFYFVVFLLLSVWYGYRKKNRISLVISKQGLGQVKQEQQVLTTNNSQVWQWQADNQSMFSPRISLDLGYEDETLFYRFEQYITLVHPEDSDNFHRCWALFIDNAKLDNFFSCTYRLKTVDGKWLWYKDLGKIIAVDVQGRAISATGNYVNITETRANEERAQYYGDAFQQTQDWVFIVDEKISRVTVNQSMSDVFDLPETEFDFNEEFLGIGHKRRRFYQQLLLSLREGEHWRGEELIVTVNEDEYYVIINITVGWNSISKALHYLFVLTDISEQKKAENKLRLLVNYDPLTGLPNRTLLLERINHAIDFAKRKSKSMAVLFIDLDRFKQVNDSLGHDKGDQLLQEVTHRLEKTLRIDDTLARIGGDEFVVLLENFSNNNQLGRIAEKVINTIGIPVQLAGNLISVGASVGIALYPNDGNQSDELLRHADVAMYHAKQGGRNNFKFYTAQMNIDAMERLRKETALKLALKNDQFINHYQPIVDAHTGKAVGVEMLMRWQTPSELIAPNDFIPLAEELNLIIPMTECAIELACKDLKAWHSIRPDFYLSINVFVQHFAEEDLALYIKGLLLRYQLPAKMLRIEVTESALILQPDNAITTMRELAAMGVKLALDDFGTGFSSLSYLKQLPLDIIKIDRSFVAGIGVHEADEAIVDITIALAKRLNMYCIAEGVETQKQLDYLVNKECHYIQGYLYSRPVSAEKIMQNLSLNKIELIATAN